MVGSHNASKLTDATTVSTVFMINFFPVDKKFNVKVIDATFFSIEFGRYYENFN
jgi:hypothetical protein